jgi:hypothetical protein
MFSTSNGPTLVYTSPYEKPGFFVPPIASVSDNPIKNEINSYIRKQKIVKGYNFNPSKYNEALITENKLSKNKPTE